MTRRCRGRGFVHLDEPQTGAALDALNGRLFGNRVLCVTYEKKDSKQGAFDPSNANKPSAPSPPGNRARNPASGIAAPDTLFAAAGSTSCE